VEAGVITERGSYVFSAFVPIFLVVLDSIQEGNLLAL
jgi:hypothetical protein